MKTTAEYNANEKVKLVGPGMAGMPEVESEDGSTCLTMPHNLKPCES